MFTIDTSTDFGARVARRLRHEQIGWLVTVDGDGTPQPSPIWFLWEKDAGTLLIYSRPDAPKMGNIAANPRVALHLDGDGRGGDIVVLTGSARHDEDAPPADAVPAYVEKYREGIVRIGMEPESMAAAYSAAIRVTPEELRGHCRGGAVPCGSTGRRLMAAAAPAPPPARRRAAGRSPAGDEGASREDGMNGSRVGPRLVGIALAAALAFGVGQSRNQPALARTQPAGCGPGSAATPGGAATPAAVAGTPAVGDSGTRVQLGDGEALVWGDGTAGAVLAHGAIYDAASWRPQAEAIAEAGAVALAVENTSAAAILDGVRFLRERCGVETVTLIGASAGASGAFEAARIEPDAVDGLIILSASGEVGDLGEFPKLFVASEGEGIAEAARRMAEEAPGSENEALILPGDAHAQAIFTTEQGSRLLAAILERLESS